MPVTVDPRTPQPGIQRDRPTNPDCGASKNGTYRDNHVLGCTCPEAVDAGWRYRKLRGTGLLVPRTSVPAVGTWRRLRALAAAGHSLDDVAAAAGRSVGQLMRVRSGQQATVQVDTARSVTAAYVRLIKVPGRSEESRRLAARRGWAGPAAWDGQVFDLDDPAADDELAAATQGRPANVRRQILGRAQADARERAAVLAPRLPPGTATIALSGAELRQLGRGQQIAVTTVDGHPVRLVLTAHRPRRLVEAS